MANYVLQCEDCKRPASVVSKKHRRTRVGHETFKKTVSNKCECGGTIKPMID